jgi:hypothetical protein
LGGELLPGFDKAGVEIIDTTGIRSVENFEPHWNTAEIFDRLLWIARDSNCRTFDLSVAAEDSPFGQTTALCPFQVPRPRQARHRRLASHSPPCAAHVRGFPGLSVRHRLSECGVQPSSLFSHHSVSIGKRIVNLVPSLSLLSTVIEP